VNALQTHQPAALGDLRILDFSRVLAGPFATMMLADLGATVIKVERPDVGDETRSWGPPRDAHGRATYFQSVNRNKDSVVIDLATDDGCRQAHELAASADVLVENFRPGVMESLGLGHEALHAAHPGLVYCSITGFGDGDGARLPGYDLLVQALGGLMSITGAPDGEPQKVGVALVDVFSCLLASLVNQGAAYTVAGVVPGRMGNAHPSISPYEVYPTADGELVLAVGNDRQFVALCEVLGDPALALDPRFAMNPSRVTHRDALQEALVDRLRVRAAAQWASELTAARVPAGVVNDIAGAFTLAQQIGLDPIVEIPDPITGETVALTRNPIGLSATPATYRSAPPPLGGAASG
jgi:crotonobetainyl-CoA:carnitine CoA-transferase CaiB-like acyl-CoA transferase